MPVSATILAVDDNEAHCYALAKTLKKRGYNVLQAMTGSETLRLAAQKPDLILLDINLPDFNGFEIMRRLREDPVTANIPVVFITATAATSSSHQMAQQLGASGFLIHPVDPGYLDIVIEATLQKSAAGDKVPGSPGKKNSAVK